MSSPIPETAVTDAEVISEEPSCPPKRSALPSFFRISAYNPRIVLENSGSVARDHLASERTFLAYVRTSLALASTGVALVQLFTIADLTSRAMDISISSASQRVQHFARPLGVSTVVLGLILLFIAFYRYFVIQNALTDNKFPVARLSVAFSTFILGSIIVVTFAALLNEKT